MIKLRYSLLIAIMAIGAADFSLEAHDGDLPSIHDTVAGIKHRLVSEVPYDKLAKMNDKALLALVTSTERKVLSAGALRFSVNTQVDVSVVTPINPPPFWLEERGFQIVSTNNLKFALGEFDLYRWTKRMDSGRIGLGVPSLTSENAQYAIALKVVDPGEELKVTELYPGELRLAEWKAGQDLYVDLESKPETVPAELEGQVLIQNIFANRDDGVFAGIFRFTDHPAADNPDQVVLTWSDDPQTTQTIQWRTSTNIARGVVAYQKKALLNRFQSASRLQSEASFEKHTDQYLLNNPDWHRFETTLRDLEPGTTYVYSIGNGTPEGWSEFSEFTTAPGRVTPFSFVYMGDAQNGLDRWGTLVHNAFRQRPDAAFYIMAGDLVNRGQERDDWDSFYYNSADIYDRRQLVPVIGNHENQSGHPTLYLKNFTLPLNGASEIEKERSYFFEYSNALFVVLDTNEKPEKQKEWLDQTLTENTATWKFVVYHHPAYSSAKNRDNKGIREHWLPIFDKHHVDLALQGHDHAYLRTYPMKNEKRVKTTKEGTVYIVSVSGTKMYEQDPRDYTEMGFTKISTYQTIDLQIAGDRLLYRAYDTDGRLRDELEIVK